MNTHIDLKINEFTASEVHINNVGFKKLYSVPTYNLSEDSLWLEVDLLDISDYNEIYSITSIAKKISSLYQQKNFFGILALLPKLKKFLILSSSIRIIVALTLFILGRIGGALREVSLLIEMENNPIKIRRYIQCVSCLFEKLDFSEKEYESLDEILNIALKKQSINLIEKLDMVKLMILEKKTRCYNLYLKDCLLVMPRSDFDSISEMKLEDQAQKYLDNDGNLGTYSLGRLCISTRLQIKGVLTTLKSWNNISSTKGNENPIQLMVNEIVKLAPTYLYDSLKEHESLIHKYMTYEFHEMTGIDCNGNVEMMSLLLQDNSTKVIRGEISTFVMVINYKIVLGYLQFLSQNYHDAMSHFEFTLSLLSNKSKRLGFLKEKTKSLITFKKRVVAVLLHRCYEFGEIPYNDKRLKELYITFTNATKTSSKYEYQSGRHSIYHISFGLLYEGESIKQASRIVLENNQHDVVGIAYRLEQRNLDDMVRKYIIAATNKAQDDPSINILYDRIIWGILLSGGIHLKTLWFFSIVRNYFSIESDSGPLHISPELGFKIFSTDDILNQYENSWNLINEFTKVYTALTLEEEKNIWKVENNNKYLIPQVFEGGDKLLLAEQFYDENNQNNLPSFILTSRFQVKQKAKVNMMIEEKLISDRIKVSKDFIFLWYKTYKENHDSVPNFVTNLVDELFI